MRYSILLVWLLATAALSAPQKFPKRTSNMTDTSTNQPLIEQLELAATASARLALIPDPQDHKYDFLNPPFANLITTGKGTSHHSLNHPSPPSRSYYPAHQVPQIH